MKKLINDPRHVVRDMLEGLADLYPGLALLDAEDVIVRSDLPPPPARPVAVLSGGGSGHEPAHAGYVGAGMLSAAIAGDVFTSPSVDAVLAAIRAAGGPAGAVLIVKNYTGDRLNFGLAAELATADGIPTRVVVVADDVALHDTVEPSRRRGIAGTVLVHKVAGAAAAAGLALDAVVAEANLAASALGTMGVALGACIVPAAGKPGFSLGDDEMELGLGIHGEQGVRRVPLQAADAVVDTIIATLIAQMGLQTERVALLVNGLGGTPPMELAIVARRALAVLRSRGIRVERAWAGNFMTALEMPGCSLSLMVVDDARLKRLDVPVDAPAWPGGGRVGQRRVVASAVSDPAVEAPADAVNGAAGNGVRRAALAAASALEREEAALTDLDSRAGDGDLGISMVRGATAIRAMPEAAWRQPVTALTAMANVVRRAIAGSSGPFYATALLRAARELGSGPVTAEAWARAFAGAVASVGALGGAKRGDRSMLDALEPAHEAFSAAVAEGATLPESWKRALAAAEEGTAATAAMHPRVGRAAYLGDRAIGAPDAGATAVVVWMRGIAAAFD
ncbi:dihydroxyacetone kinase family protein [Acidisphaera sp. S103]|uniref:dihydroxyacetone kinase family protein n=1 Tax=Acidisphaera sp. S103 TaxID=1747223 RepID=UPI00131C7A88|nr:dihydroxyacetone kinase family protein [Acidisphaera sp. S103]